MLTPPPVHPSVPVTARPDARQQHGGREEDGEWERAAPASRGGGPASAGGGRCAGRRRGAGRAAVGQSGPRHGLRRGPGAAGAPGRSRRGQLRPSELGPCPPCTGCQPRPAAASPRLLCPRSPPVRCRGLLTGPLCWLEEGAAGAEFLVRVELCFCISWHVLAFLLERLRHVWVCC